MKLIRRNLKIDNKDIRSYEDLINHFNIDDLYVTYQNGLLPIWLESHEYNDLLLKLNKIDNSQNPILIKRELCNVFGYDSNEIEHFVIDDDKKKLIDIAALDKYESLKNERNACVVSYFENMYGCIKLLCSTDYCEDINDRDEKIDKFYSEFNYIINNHKHIVIRMFLKLVEKEFIVPLLLFLRRRGTYLYFKDNSYLLDELYAIIDEYYKHHCNDVYLEPLYIVHAEDVNKKHINISGKVFIKDMINVSDSDYVVIFKNNGLGYGNVSKNFQYAWNDREKYRLSSISINDLISADYSNHGFVVFIKVIG